jgi:hypothetical protein
LRATKKAAFESGQVVTAIAEKGCSGQFATHIAKAVFFGPFMVKFR